MEHLHVTRQNSGGQQHQGDSANEQVDRRHVSSPFLILIHDRQGVPVGQFKVSSSMQQDSMIQYGKLAKRYEENLAAVWITK